MTDTPQLFKVVENHVAGPAIIGPYANLVDNGPLDSIVRMTAALNATFTADMHWAIPEFDALSDMEAKRVIRALGNHIQMEGK